ncbi:MAG: hypothetical protein WCP11_00080 [Candidatus Saccharibacteria bacterium]
MKKTNIRRLIYQIRHKYLTLNNAVIAVALIIAAGWVWGSLDVMQRNYKLQKELDDKSRQLIVAQLDTDSARLEQRYYKTDEYKELAVRQRLGLVTPGESALNLPANSDAVKNEDKVNLAAISKPEPVQSSNFSQWMNFLFGGNSKSISK